MKVYFNIHSGFEFANNLWQLKQSIDILTILQPFKEDFSYTFSLLFANS